MKQTIEDTRISYENLKVKFKGDDNWYFMNTKTLNGLIIDGNIIKKKTRTWFGKVMKND